jgi:hypothetical protein
MRNISNILDFKLAWCGFCIGLIYIYLTIPYPDIIKKEKFEEKKSFQCLK